ncbi:MAG: (Na+)-NQR maturation NqrM [Azoarcus sp.]|nr:(Na+)-NQR maturation NqrM [Azoarcus sp.]
MTIYIVTFLIMGIAVLAMAVGVLAGRKPIAGSCGGLGKFNVDCVAGCDKPCPKREARAQAEHQH